MKQVKNVSVTQVKTARDCMRKWWYRWILGLETPRTASQERGVRIHKEQEIYVATGEDPPPSEETPYFKAIKKYLGPWQEGLWVPEHKMELPTPFEIPWIGYVDILRFDTSPHRVVDLKSTSDFRYALTPAEMLDDTQVNVYAHYAYEVLDHPEDEDIGIELLYVKTAKKPPKTKLPAIKSVVEEIDRSHAQSIWDRDMELVSEMLEAAKVEKESDVEPDTSACSKYGGCPFRTRCTGAGADLFKNIATARQHKKESRNFVMGWRDRIKNNSGSNNYEETKKSVRAKDNARKRKKEEEEIEEEEEEASVPNGVLADDAASRETSDEEAEEIQAKAEEKKKRKTATKKTATTKKTTTKKTAATKKKTTDTVIYINCVPMKGEHRDMYTLFEDWIAPVIQEMNEQVKEENDLPDYMLLDYGPQKALFSMAVRENINRQGLPPALVIKENAQAREALSEILPLVNNVVRGV